MLPINCPCQATNRFSTCGHAIQVDQGLIYIRDIYLVYTSYTLGAGIERVEPVFIPCSVRSFHPALAIRPCDLIVCETAAMGQCPSAQHQPPGICHVYS